jgi:hypothetical protein
VSVKQNIKKSQSKHNHKIIKYDSKHSNGLKNAKKAQYQPQQAYRSNEQRIFWS